MEDSLPGRPTSTSEDRDPNAVSASEGVPCPFCDLTERRPTAANALAVAFRDSFPVNPGHTLIIPKRHVPTWFEATREEQVAILELTDQIKVQLDAELHPAGYNLGLNVGEAAGQTVPHLHLHLIPRFGGDVDDPTGGVRFVIPQRGNYLNPGFIPKIGYESLLAGPSDRSAAK